MLHHQSHSLPKNTRVDTLAIATLNMNMNRFFSYDNRGYWLVIYQMSWPLWMCQLVR
jgi:hypothetical protein